MAEKELRHCSLFTARIDKKTLSCAIKAFFDIAQNASQNTFAIFYAPHRCFLAKRNGDEFEVKESGFDLNKVFEARVFNEASEMRWLNDPNGDHATAILSETQLIFDGKTLEAESNVIGGLNQEYLLWGEKVKLKASEQNPSGWTKFATARVGTFDVPIETDKRYSRFKAVEYLKKYEDGNVAVVDERLTGIEGYKGD
jgi:CRISPR-associated protein (TIGR03984 family)